MSNFLVVSSSNDRSAERIFSTGIRATKRIKSQSPSSIVAAPGSLSPSPFLEEVKRVCGTTPITTRPIQHLVAVPPLMGQQVT